MKIIKYSKKPPRPYHSFTCKCGCMFQCEEDEYWKKPQVRYESYPGGACSYSYSAYKTFMTCCPECHKVVEDSVYDSSETSFYGTCNGVDTGNCDGDNVLDKSVKIECNNKK